jgi:hypothetical protein
MVKNIINKADNFFNCKKCNEISCDNLNGEGEICTKCTNKFTCIICYETKPYNKRFTEKY